MRLRVDAIVAGIAVNLRQVLNLNRDIDWLEQFRSSDPERRIAADEALQRLAEGLGVDGAAFAAAFADPAMRAAVAPGTESSITTHSSEGTPWAAAKRNQSSRPVAPERTRSSASSCSSGTTQRRSSVTRTSQRTRWRSTVR